MWEKIKALAVEQVLWAEKALGGLSNKEKRDAVVQKIDDLIVLPPMLEPFDGPVIGFIVDMVVDKLNNVLGHNFGEAKVTGEQAEAIAETLVDPVELFETLEGE